MELSNLDSALSEITRTASENSAWSAEQAQIQREWQEEQNAKAMAFNSREAAKNRDWQQLMSNTAHQREIADLKAAGLNPVLSAMGGNGAAVTSGATASGVTSTGAKGERDTSANSAIVGLLGSFLSAQTQLEAANVNARTQEAIADKYAAVDEIVANINASASRYASKQANEASHYSVDNPNTVVGLLRSMFTGDEGVKGTARGLAADALFDDPATGGSGKTPGPIVTAINGWLKAIADKASYYDSKYGEGTGIIPGKIKDWIASSKRNSAQSK